MPNPSLYLLLLAVAAVASAACAGFFLARDPSRRPNQLAAVLMIGSAFWAFCEFAWNQAPDAETAVFLIRASSPGWLFIGPVVLHVFLSSSLNSWPRLWRLLPFLYAASAAFLLAAWFSPAVTAEAIPTAWGYGYEVGPLFPVFYSVTMVGVVSGVVVVSRDFMETYSPGERRQQPWIVAGVGLPLCVASATDALLPMLGIQLPRLGTTSLAILGCISLWCVYRFGYSFLTPGSFADEILAALPDGVALLEGGGRIRSTNLGFARLSGLTLGELTGMRLCEVIVTGTGDTPEELDELECELRRKDGERIPVAASTTALSDRHGNPVGLLLVVRDLREVADLRHRLVTTARLAAVGELAAGIAHEINNPIAFVRSNLGVLEDHCKTVGVELAEGIRERGLEPVVGEAEELIAECLEGVDRAAAIVRGVKGFSHAGDGTRDHVDLNELLDEVLYMARGELRGRIEIERAYGDLPPVSCVPQELKQVFLNLIVNAAQAAGDRGNIRLRTRSAADGVFVEVRDDGPGIPPEIIDRIFDPFFTTKAVGEGTGLGLGIAYQIVGRHEGELTVESEPGRGACFRVRLPARPGA